MAKRTRNWWMIFKPFLSEPLGLWRVYLFSMGITLLLLSLAALCAYYKHGSWSEEPKIGYKAGHCPQQSDCWDRLLVQAAEDREAATTRLELVKSSRSDPNGKYFSQSWTWFESEILELQKSIKRSQNYQIAPIGKTFPPIILFVFVSLLFFVLIGRLVLLHAKSTDKLLAPKETGQDPIGNWGTPQILFGLLIAVCMTLAEVSTSVLAKQKFSFGWDSFCVTPSAFIVKCSAFIGYGLVAATPFTILWCLSKRGHIPPPDLSARDGKFGAERYVEFLQTWTLWLILAPSALGIAWVQYINKMEKVFSPAHLLHGLGVGLIIALIVVKLIRNAIILRFKCREAVAGKELGETRKEPTDPTIAFLGAEWWKLPATITVSLASIWALLEWAGVAKIIMNIIK
jgi:hypothetical protein